MDRFPHRLVAAERERHIGNAAAHLDIRQGLLDQARGIDVIQAVIVMFLDARGDRENVGIKNDVLRRKAYLIHKNAVAARANVHFALKRISLTCFIERHDNYRRPVAKRKLRMFDEFRFAFLQADGIDDCLALNAFQSRFDHRPLARIQHDGHTADIRLGGDKVQERNHRLLRVEHRFIHVDIDDLRATLDLVAGNTQRFRIIVVQYQASEGFGTGDIGSLADIHEQ